MQLARFLLVGALNTGLGLSCIFVAMWTFSLDYRLANIIGYTIGCISGYFLNRSWTFHYHGSWRVSFLRWMAVTIIACTSNLLTVVTLHQHLHINPYLAQFGGVAVYTLASFLGARHFAFRKPE